jgi:hypothetical protein
MKLKHLFDLYTPFHTKEDIDDFFVYLNGRNTTMTEEIKEKLLNSSDDTIKLYMQEKIVSYIKNYKVRPGKPKSKGQTAKQSKAHLTSSRDYYKREYPDSLAAKGYEYGLSDW